MEYLRNYVYLLAAVVFTCGVIFSRDVYSSVTINEVAIQPNQIVELYNSASISADISYWHIDDSGGTTYFTIPENTILHPQSCAVFSSDFNFNKSSPDIVRLFDNTSIPTSSSAHLVDQYSYLKAPDMNLSFGKTNEGGTDWTINTSSLGLSNTLLTSCVPTPTPLPTMIDPTITVYVDPSPTTEQITPTMTQHATLENIFISELYPYPFPTEHEWIELYNGNDFQVDLNRWYVDDGENAGSIPKMFTLSINPHSYGVFEISISLFNNSGDFVRLLDDEKKEIDSLEYGEVKQGQSIGRMSVFDDMFCEQDASKNNENTPCIVKQTTKKISIANKAISIPTTLQVPKKIIRATSNIDIPISKRDIVSLPQSDILGVSTERTDSISSVPLLPLLSASHSLLTIVSIFIKMKNAQV